MKNLTVSKNMTLNIIFEIRLFSKSSLMSISDLFTKKSFFYLDPLHFFIQILNFAHHYIYLKFGFLML